MTPEERAANVLEKYRDKYGGGPAFSVGLARLIARAIRDAEADVWTEFRETLTEIGLMSEVHEALYG